MQTLDEARGPSGPLSRRELLRQAGSGFGLLGLAGLLAKEQVAAAANLPEPTSNPLALQAPHHAPRAKRCIFLYMPGGPSQLDLLDPKPLLGKLHGKPLPFAKPKLERRATGNILASPWTFRKYGQAGIDISDLLPHLATCAEDLCVIRSVVADNINHMGAALQLNTGEQTFSRPSVGAWVVYGLGSENQDLPGFVVISPQPVLQAAPLWGASFLPAAYQGTWVQDLKNPIRDLKNPFGKAERQRRQLDVLKELNELHKRQRLFDSELDARIASFELAFRMQMRAPEAFALDRESRATRRLYGLDDPLTEDFGKQCLLARRLVERGVRFVQLYDSAKGNVVWDHHSDLKKLLPLRCANVDRPIAGLLKDLKARGLLDETLVVWGGEFGRSPMEQGGLYGREHHPFGFTMWLAGGGVKGGHIHGATDDFGFYAIQDNVHIHDLHATILHVMGIDHARLTYRYGGRDFRLTDVSGRVVRAILA